MSDSKAGFTCVICQRFICTRWNMPGRVSQIEPVCTGCEGQYTQGIGKPTDGSFRDRRNVIRGFSLAEALHDEAARQNWSKRHAIA
ncbi:MAG TPA: hypothetical protein VKQ27_08785 [Acetobacteraceae bacterium]|nr:hypothetical protein [Acetobacteraceae bacterium]